MREAAHFDELGQEQIDEAHGEVTMNDRAAERTVRSALDIDMDPLVITGNIGEPVHPVLVDPDPVRWAEARADQREQVGGLIDNPGHAQARWLETESTSPVM